MLAEIGAVCMPVDYQALRAENERRYGTDRPHLAFDYG
jgi:murein endopeptidase